MRVNYSIFNLIIEENNENWINYIDSNGFLIDSWKTEYGKPMEVLDKNWKIGKKKTIIGKSLGSYEKRIKRND